MISGKPTTPMKMFGNPKVEACQDSMTWPQETHGLMSQAVEWLLSCQSWMRS